MKILQSVAVAASLSAPLFSQTLTREYRFDFADSELALGTTTAAAEAGASNYPIPEVDEGPLVQIVGLGFQMSGTQRAEADLVNATSSSVVASTGVRTPNHWGFIGNPYGCAIGVDACTSGCTTGGGSVTLPPNSSQTFLHIDNTVQINSGTGVGASSTWPCILAFSSLNTRVQTEYSNNDASAVRVESTIEGHIAVTAELTLNSSAASSCAGTLNSLGQQTLLEYYGSMDAGTENAAVRVSQLRSGSLAFCLVTNASDVNPIGTGIFSSLCLRGARRFQAVQLTEGPATAGEAIFDLNLQAFTPGESIAVQVVHRDTTSPWNTSNMLTGTAQ